MKRLLTLWLCLCASAVLAQSHVGTYSWLPPRAPAPNFNPANETPTYIGDFVLVPNLTLYIPVDSFARARVFTSTSSGTYDRRILTRAFDPDERLVHWQYQDLEQPQPLYYPQDNYVQGLAPLPLSTGSGHSISSDAEFALAGAGIHQIRVTSRQLNMSCKVALSQPLSYGVSLQNGYIQRWSSCPDTLHFLIAPNTTQLTFRLTSGNLTVIDDANMSTPITGTTQIPVPANSVGTVWKMVANGNFKFRAWGMPIIFCNDAATAQTIGASVHYSVNGTLYKHKIQETLHKAMSLLLDSAKVGDANNMIVTNYGPYQSDWLADPLRNKHLITGYRPTFAQPLFDRLSDQNVDASDHWGGTWQANPTGRWDNYEATPNIGGQLDASAQQAFAIGYIATLNMPFNPYYQYQSELTHRATAACFLDLQKMQEGEHFPRYDTDPYTGHPAFTLGQRTLPAYGLISPQMPDSIQDIWTEAVRHLIDRHLCDYITTTRNQTAHFLVAFEYFAQGSQDPVYQSLSQRFARLFVSSQSPAGWFEEAYGPCGSYNGITNYFMSKYYRMSGDTLMGNSIDKAYDFFNHTIAPEPDDRTLLGGFNFNHRIGEGSFGEQYGGATLLGRGIPGPGIRRKQTQAEITADSLTAVTQITNALNNLSGQDPGQWSPSYYDHYLRVSDTSYIWPAYREPFSRNFADDMVAVKTSTYFTNIFTGHPAGALWQLSSRELVREPRTYETDTNHVYIANTNKVAPLLGGGVSTFWTPDYGTALMATNWSPDFHNGLVATVQDSTTRRYWEDYLAISSTWDSVQNELHMLGEVEAQDLQYDREIIFRDCYLDCAVDITANANFGLMDLSEFIPLATGQRKQYDVHFDEGTDSLFPGHPRSYFTVCNSAGHGVKILFDSLATLTHIPGMAGAYNRYRVDQLKMDLPNSGTQGDQLYFGYHLIPFSGLTRGQAGFWQWQNNTLDDSGHELHGDSLPHNYGLWQGSCPYIELDGMGERVETVPFAHSLDEMSIALWAKSDNGTWASDGPFVSKANAFVFRPNPTASPSQIEFAILVNSAQRKVAFDLVNIPGFDVSDWHHYAATFEGSNGHIRLYVDGQFRATTPITSPNTLIDYAHNSLWFGAGFGTNTFDGLLGEARYFSTTLSDSAIMDLYQLRAGCFNPITAIDLADEQEAIFLYPNPANEKVSLTSNSEIEQVELYSVMGRLIRRWTPDGGTQLLMKVADLPAGSYLIRCKTINGRYTKKLILK